MLPCIVPHITHLWKSDYGSNGLSGLGFRVGHRLFPIPSHEPSLYPCRIYPYHVLLRFHASWGISILNSGTPSTRCMLLENSTISITCWFLVGNTGVCYIGIHAGIIFLYSLLTTRKIRDFVGVPCWFGDSAPLALQNRTPSPGLVGRPSEVRLENQVL